MLDAVKASCFSFGWGRKSFKGSEMKSHTNARNGLQAPRPSLPEGSGLGRPRKNPSMAELLGAGSEPTQFTKSTSNLSSSGKDFPWKQKLGDYRNEVKREKEWQRQWSSSRSFGSSLRSLGMPSFRKRGGDTPSQNWLQSHYPDSRRVRSPLGAFGVNEHEGWVESADQAHMPSVPRASSRDDAIEAWLAQQAASSQSAHGVFGMDDDACSVMTRHTRPETPPLDEYPGSLVDEQITPRVPSRRHHTTSHVTWDDATSVHSSDTTSAHAVWPRDSVPENDGASTSKQDNRYRDEVGSITSHTRGPGPATVTWEVEDASSAHAGSVASRTAARALSGDSRPRGDATGRGAHRGKSEVPNKQPQDWEEVLWGRVEPETAPPHLRNLSDELSQDATPTNPGRSSNPPSRAPRRSKFAPIQVSAPPGPLITEHFNPLPSAAESSDAAAAPASDLKARVTADLCTPAPRRVQPTRPIIRAPAEGTPAVLSTLPTANLFAGDLTL